MSASPVETPARGPRLRRRSLLLSGLGVAGALVVGWSVLPARSRLGDARLPRPGDTVVTLNGWLAVLPDGHVQLAMNRSEMGQGIHTALSMLVAEELDMPLSHVHLVPAGRVALYGNVAAVLGNLPLHPTDTEPGAESRGVRVGRWMVGKVARELGINMTGGSSSVADGWEVLRLAAATARAQLLGAASLRWHLPLAELSLKAGVVHHPSGANAHFGDLAREAASTSIGSVTLKDPSQFTLIGTAAPRTDVAAKVDGSAVFGIDVRLPDQLVAVLRHSPQLGGTPGRVDVARALAVRGVERVVRLGSYAGSAEAVAVVGRSYWHAQRGAMNLDIEWREPHGPRVDTREIMAGLERSARAAAADDGGVGFYSRGDLKAAEAASVRQVEAVYRAPYLAHAPMEPINCTARVHGGRVEVWAPTQAPTAALAVAAQAAGVSEDAVTLHVTYLGGGFGRRLDVDFIGQAVRIAVETNGRPVQLVWPREEDLAHDFYRPASVAVLKAGIDGQGSLQTLRITSAGDAVTPRYIERTLPALAGPVDAPDKTTSEGLFDLPYDIAHQRIAHEATRHGVPVGYWRSVGHSHNAFFSESFVDEIAVALKQDPVAFRLGLLKHMPRHAAVLSLAAEKAGWGRPLPAGRARGVALHESFNTIVAQVVEVSLVNGAPKVHRVVCAADVGLVVNPGIVAQQMEGGVIFGLTAALHGRIDIHDGAVQQANFPSYPLLTLAESPRIETHLVPSARPPGGAGEPGTPPVAPALANALFALTGQRLRELPLRLS
ncbi:MAG: hypothetical protein RLZZ618_2546 [Pseudomonadota bacterium]|jgi:isoquinoline 1-oxidoreductase beta subunit